MSVVVIPPVESPFPTRRPFGRRVMHVVRRGHLYLGLFLFPWAVLYGITSFLFNHPTAFADQPAVSFDKSATAGTTLETLPTPQEHAVQVVALLNDREKAKAKDAKLYTLVRLEDVSYNREFAFATAKAEERQISILVDVRNGGGSIRSKAEEPVKPVEKAPFAIGGSPRGAGGPVRGAAADGLKIDGPLHERFKDSIPTILKRSGIMTNADAPIGEVTVTSVPDLVFYVESNGKVWKATYNAKTGVVAGQAADEIKAEPLTVRRFLTRLHLAHGYPSSVGARWGWAVVVDVMAFVLVFWGVSGLFMWWQIKATRWSGFAVLLVSAAAATALGWGMYTAIAS